MVNWIKKHHIWIIVIFWFVSLIVAGANNPDNSIIIGEYFGRLLINIIIFYYIVKLIIKVIRKVSKCQHTKPTQSQV